MEQTTFESQVMLELKRIKHRLGRIEYKMDHRDEETEEMTKGEMTALENDVPILNEWPGTSKPISGEEFDQITEWLNDHWDDETVGFYNLEAEIPYRDRLLRVLDYLYSDGKFITQIERLVTGSNCPVESKTLIPFERRKELGETF